MATSTSLKNKVAIVGVGESDIGKVPQPVRASGSTRRPRRRALDDAGLKPSDIDGLLTAYSFTEPYTMLGSSLCEYMGMRPRMCASMVAGGASPGIMLRHAAQAIAMGLADTVLVCAGENRATGLGREAAIAVLTQRGPSAVREALRRLDPRLSTRWWRAATCTNTARRASSSRAWP